MTRDLLRETVRMGRLVDHLLLLARSDAGTINAERVPVDMDEVVRESVATVDARCRSPPQPSSPSRCRVSPTCSSTSSRNLLENAERYAQDSVDVVAGAPTARTRSSRSTTTGPASLRHKRGDVLERFVRVDESRERGTGGTGLGLAIVREIVDLHAGELDILDSPSGGARVSEFCCPSAETPLVSRMVPGPTSPVWSAQAVPTNQGMFATVLRILHVTSQLVALVFTQLPIRVLEDSHDPGSGHRCGRIHRQPPV